MTEMLWKRILCLMIATAVSILFWAAPAAALADDPVKVESVGFQREDFIKGIDVSSVISLENAGVRFYDEHGREKDLFLILAENGVNCIRVRIWNDPYDRENHPYGGGNNDVSAACKIAKRCAKYGLSMLLDFHYSDFWADPSKQKAPKAWSGFSVEEKEQAVYDFTLDALRQVRSVGGKIRMVQIGNETTSGIAGESDTGAMVSLFNAGSRAVRMFDEDVLVVLHFTDPQKTDTIKWFADMLAERHADYDVFAVSYYPYWHGSLQNLFEVLDYAASTYDKYAMVAETSYAYTLEDSDGHPNTVSQWSNATGDNLLWDFTPQGQAEELRAVMNAVNQVNNARGIGVFYWEGAWITAGDTTGLSGNAYEQRVKENDRLWQTFGCGWATRYSCEYDDDDAGGFYGGSAVDNQAFFDSKGYALPSLRVFLSVSGYDRSYVTGDADEDGVVTVLDATAVQRHLASLKALGDIGYTAADFERNGRLTILSSTAIQRYLASLPTSYPIEKRIFE